MIKMNRGKTELLVLNGRHHPLPPLTTISVYDEEINRSTKARNIDVICGSFMSMENHIMAICKAAFYHLRNIRRIRKYLSSQTGEMLVHAFVSSRLDYCNSLLYGLPKESINGHRLVDVGYKLARYGSMCCDSNTILEHIFLEKLFTR